jgi:hypothetical protein
VFIVYVGFFPQVACLFGKREKPFENRHAKQSVVGNQWPDLKQPRVTEKQQNGIYRPVYSLKRNHARCLVCKFLY